LYAACWRQSEANARYCEAFWFAGLTLEQRDKGHWMIAIRMLNNALKEPNYLKTATMSLQTAFILEGILASPHPLDSH